MPTLTPAQHKQVRALLDARTLDAAKNVFRVTLGMDPEQVCDDAMNEMREEIAKVFYPLIGRFISGEPIDGSRSLPPAPSAVPESPRLTDLRTLISGVLTVPDFPGIQHLKESAQRMQEWLDHA